MRAQFLSIKSISGAFSTFLPGLKNLLDKKPVGPTRQNTVIQYGFGTTQKIFQMMKRDLTGSLLPELGPGDSFGTGIAALFSGCKTYTAIDAVQHFNTEANLAALHDIHELFQQEHPIPGPDEFPLEKPLLATYAFPGFLIPNSKNFSIEYKERITQFLKNFNHASSLISFLPAHSISDHNSASKFDRHFFPSRIGTCR
jgi:hypothetical protein